MSKGTILRSLVAERLNAAAEEIFVLIEKTVLEYEEELCRSKEENLRKQQLLDTVLSPQINRAGVQFRMLSRPEESEGIFQQTVQTPQPVQMTQEIQVEDISEPEPEPETEPEPEPEPELHLELEPEPEPEEPEPEPKESTAAESEPHAVVIVETEQQPEERIEELEPPFSCSSQEMDTEADDEDDANLLETNKEATDVQTPTAPDVETPTVSKKKPKKSKPKKRKYKKSTKFSNPKRHGKHQCTVCGKILRGPYHNLIRHMVIHTGEKPYTCQICKKKFAQQFYLKKHMEGHQKEEEEKRLAQVKELETFKCSVCDLRFKRQVALKKHMEVHNVARKLPKRGGLRQTEQHREVGVQPDPPKDEEAEHPTESQHNPHDYTRATLVKKPLDFGAHAAPGEFGCNICKRTFTTRTRLKRHMIVHTGAKPFSCTICHKHFSQKYNVRLHMAVHTNEKPYTCDICMKSYRRNDDLRTHMATHTGQILFSCMVCNAAFKQRNCLVTHMRLHTGDRPYKCSHCDKTFVQKSNLNRHERSHTGEKPFRCPVCPQRFLQRCDIRKHMAVHT